jgi:hypothetical protein
VEEEVAHGNREEPLMAEGVVAAAQSPVGYTMLML